MKNVTITMDEDVLGWVRVEAAKRGQSVSRYVGGVLTNERERRDSQVESVRRFLAFPKRPLSREDGTLPSRDEIYDDPYFRRHERLGLHSGFSESDQTESGGELD